MKKKHGDSIMCQTRINILLLILFIAALAAGCDNTSARKPPWAPRKSSMEKIIYELDKTANGKGFELHIPTAYLDDFPTSYGGKRRKVDVIALETGLPDLLPRKADFFFPKKYTPDEFEHLMAIKKDGIYIALFDQTLIPEDWLRMEDGIKSKKVEGELYGLTGYLDYGLPDYCYHGLSENAEYKKICHSMYSDIFMARKYDGVNSVYMRCLPDKNNRCTTDTSVCGIKSQYSFIRTELHRWREFDAGVRKLISEFIPTKTQKGGGHDCNYQ